MSEDETPELQAFLDLCAQVNSTVKTRIYLDEQEREFQRVLDQVIAHPDRRPVYAKAFRMIIFRHRSITDDLVAFCMRTLRWPEVAEAIRQRLTDELHNSEYTSLEKILELYPPQGS